MKPSTRVEVAKPEVSELISVRTARRGTHRRVTLPSRNRTRYMASDVINEAAKVVARGHCGKRPIGRR